MKMIMGLAISALAMGASAGQIELKNGDKIGGKLKAVNKDQVVWTADKMGELTINKSDVGNLSSSEPVRLRGIDKPCLWVEMTGDLARFNCDSEQKEYSLLTLKDVVPFAQYEDAMHSYGGKLTLVGSEKSGNVNSSNWLVGAEVKLRHNDFRHDFALRYTGESLEVEPAEGEEPVEPPVVEYYQAFYGLNWFFLPRWFLLGDLTAEKDDAKQISERYVAGLGSGFQWWELEKSALKLELSALNTKEYFELTAADVALGQERKRDFTSARFAVDYRHKFAGDIALFTRGNISQNFDQSNDWRSRAELGLSAPLGFGVSAHFNIDYDYQNAPQEGVEKEDVTYRVGVVYTW